MIWAQIAVESMESWNQKSDFGVESWNQVCEMRVECVESLEFGAVESSVESWNQLCEILESQWNRWNRDS